jgi:hypothetical protein
MNSRGWRVSSETWRLRVNRLFSLDISQPMTAYAHGDQDSRLLLIVSNTSLDLVCSATLTMRSSSSLDRWDTTMNQDPLLSTQSWLLPPLIKVKIQALLYMRSMKKQCYLSISQLTSSISLRLMLTVYQSGKCTITSCKPTACQMPPLTLLTSFLTAF